MKLQTRQYYLNTIKRKQMKKAEKVVSDTLGDYIDKNELKDFPIKCLVADMKEYSNIKLDQAAKIATDAGLNNLAEWILDLKDK